MDDLTMFEPEQDTTPVFDDEQHTMLDANEDEDVNDDDYEDEEEAEELVQSETTSPSRIVDVLVETSNEYERKPVNGGKKEMKRDDHEVDVCSICFQLWTSGGHHRICCLPCGHIYGMSCIRKWLIWCPGDQGKCPQCKKSCTLKDIIVLYATRLSIADAKPCEASSTNYADTREGFLDLQQYISSSMDELKQRMDSLQRRAEEIDSRLYFLQQRCNELMALGQANTREQ